MSANEEVKSILKLTAGHKYGSLFWGDSLNLLFKKGVIVPAFVFSNDAKGAWVQIKYSLLDEYRAKTHASTEQRPSAIILPISGACFEYTESGPKKTPQAVWELYKRSPHMTIADAPERTEQGARYDEFNKRQEQLAVEIEDYIKELFRANKKQAHQADYSFVFANKKSQLCFNLVKNKKMISEMNATTLASINDFDVSAGECVGARLDSVWIKIEADQKRVLYGLTYTLLDEKFIDPTVKKGDGRINILDAEGNIIKTARNFEVPKKRKAADESAASPEAQEEEEEESDVELDLPKKHSRKSRRTAE